ncbi:MAG: peptide deformylase [Gammaproteobacteria bacterium]|nr:peptide deformylase [Gammaproteobacteria bacterium]
MAILPIIKAPHPLLKQVSRPVREDEFGDLLMARCQDMAETMYAAPGVGLAAIQVGDARRFVVVDPGEKDDDGVRKADGLRFMINPVIVSTAEELMAWEEGCLSVPEFWEDLVRPKWAVLRYQTPVGEHVEERFEGFSSVIVQHELDHLDGVIILDRVSRLKRSRYLKKVAKGRVYSEVP